MNQDLIDAYLKSKKYFEKEILKMQIEDEKFANEYPHATRLLELKNERRRYLLSHQIAAFNLITDLIPDIENQVPDVPAQDQSEPAASGSDITPDHSLEELKEIYGNNN